jgi:hypothetical protein
MNYTIYMPGVIDFKAITASHALSKVAHAAHRVNGWVAMVIRVGG